MSRLQVAARVTTLAMVLGCTDVEDPVRPREMAPEVSLAAEVAGAPGMIPGFRFLPPIAPATPGARPTDKTLLDLLAIEICEWDGAACVGSLVRRITAADDSPQRIQIVEDAFYRAIWHSESDGLDPTKTYRIRVLASSGELGHADVNVLARGEDPDRSGSVRLPLGATLPIKFAIDPGTGGRAGPAGGTVQFTDGVSLVLPAGALANDVFITAVPATNLPPSTLPQVPGTAWDFGPDGLVFAHPVTMTIPYDASRLPPSVIESDLRIHKLVNGTYQQQNAGRVDLVGKTVTAEVNGFSVYVIIPRNPASPQDVTAPVVRALDVLDPATGNYGSAVTLPTSSSDATLTMRLQITDDIAGVLFIDVRWISPTGQQVRFPCYTGAPPNAGSDTNGEWICQSVFPRYSESGLWTPNLVWIRDKVQNFAFYVQTQSGLCNTAPSQPHCVPSTPQITVNSSPTDIAAPVLQSLQVSLDVQPRMYGSTVSVDAASGARVVQFGFQATDNLSGIGGFVPFDGFAALLTGPSGQSPGFTGINCILATGSTLNGFWECAITVPAQAEAGTWRLTRFRVPDRTGNGGWAGSADFVDNGGGQLCNRTGNCLANPTVIVTSSGDAVPPALQSVSIQSNRAAVTTSLGVTDNLSGVTFIRVTYRSVATTQFQECFPTRSSGTPTNGTWSCTITFPSLAAPGQWVLSVQAYDTAGNTRFYSRRASDGFLCYTDPGAMPVCQDFGTTDLILP